MLAAPTLPARARTHGLAPRPRARPRLSSGSFAASLVALGTRDDVILLRRRVGRGPLLGLGLAALGRPGYINLGHDGDFPAKDVDAMRAQAFATLDAAYDAGVRYFDAARSYGLSEDFLGDWLRGRADVAPDAVIVGSKWGYTYTAAWRVDNGSDPHEVKEHTVANLEAQWPLSRARLGRYLNLYQIHSATLQSGVLVNDAVLDELARLKRTEGVKIGLTLSGPEQSETLRAAIRVERDGARLFDCVQAAWNAMEQSAGRRWRRRAMWNARHRQGGARQRAAHEAERRRVRTAGFGGAGGDRGSVRGKGDGADAAALAVAMTRRFQPMVLSGAACARTRAEHAAALEMARRMEAEPEEAERLVEEALERGRVEPEAYWSQRAGMEWN